MSRNATPWTLLEEVARDLASAIEGDLLPRDARAEARRLLMDAWLLLEGPRRQAGRRTACRLARRMDRRVASARSTASPLALPLPCPDRLGIANRLLAARRAPMEARLAALVRSADSLARSTLRMVERAEAAARQAGMVLPPAPPPAKDGGREDLELVWGDDET